MIVDDLMSFSQPVESLTSLDGNPRRGDVPAVAASLERFGQRKPIVARSSDRVVIAGNHTLAAAISLGWSEVAVVFVDDDEATSKAYALADNRTGDLGTYDDEALLALLADVPVLFGTGYSDTDLATLLDKINGEVLELDTNSDSGRAPTTGELLNIIDVSVDEPINKVHHGDVWGLNQHVLVVARLFNEHHLWKEYLTEDVCFAPYPGVYLTTTIQGLENKLLLVQPNLYLAAHLLDKHGSAFGPESIRKIS